MDDLVLNRLPRAYRVGLRLRELGADDDLIAECLDIDPAGVKALLDIGTQKLQNARQIDPDVGGH